MHIHINTKLIETNVPRYFFCDNQDRVPVIRYVHMGMTRLRRYQKQ